MLGYNKQTDGAFIEEKETNISWNFKNTDGEFGKMQAKELY